MKRGQPDRSNILQNAESGIRWMVSSTRDVKTILVIETRLADVTTLFVCPTEKFNVKVVAPW
jgi:hypothetical protein